RPRWLESQMTECASRGGPSAGRPLDQAPLEQVGLVDVLNRVLFLAHGHRKRREPDRAATELLADRPQDLAIETVEPLVVDLEQIQRRGRYGLRHDTALADLRVVTHPLE